MQSICLESNAVANELGMQACHSECVLSEHSKASLRPKVEGQEEHGQAVGLFGTKRCFCHVSSREIDLSIKHATFRLTDQRLYDNLSSLLFNVNTDDSAVKWLV